MSETYGIETSGASGRVVCMIEDQYVNIIGLPVGSARAQLVLSKDAQRIPRRLATERPEQSSTTALRAIRIGTTSYLP